MLTPRVVVALNFRMSFLFLIFTKGLPRAQTTDGIFSDRVIKNAAIVGSSGFGNGNPVKAARADLPHSSQTATNCRQYPSPATWNRHLTSNPENRWTRWVADRCSWLSGRSARRWYGYLLALQLI